MKLLKLIEFLRQRLPQVIWICVAILSGLVLVDAQFVDKEDAHTLIEHWSGFWAGFGFLGCLSIILKKQIRLKVIASLS